jgi:chromosome segregation ATPase
LRLVESLKDNTKLKSLDITGNAIAGKELYFSLVQAFRTNRTLTKLSLSKTGINEEHIQAIFKHIAHNVAIENKKKFIKNRSSHVSLVNLVGGGNCLIHVVSMHAKEIKNKRKINELSQQINYQSQDYGKLVDYNKELEANIQKMKQKHEYTHSSIFQAEPSAHCQLIKLRDELSQKQNQINSLHQELINCKCMFMRVESQSDELIKQRQQLLSEIDLLSKVK